MKSVALQNFPFVFLTASALILFFCIFVGVVWWACRKDSRRIYSHIEKFPLD